MFYQDVIVWLQSISCSLMLLRTVQGVCISGDISSVMRNTLINIVNVASISCSLINDWVNEEFLELKQIMDSGWNAPIQVTLYPIDWHVLLFWGIFLPRLSLAGENYDLSLSNLHSDRIRTSLGGDDDPPGEDRGYDPMLREVCELSVPCSL